MIFVTSDNRFESDVLYVDKLVLVDVVAEWCRPCKEMRPIMEELAKTFAGKLIVGLIDLDSNPKTAKHYKIHSIPTFLLFKNGKLVEKIVGAHPMAEFVKHIEKHGSV
ncbi:thioredoxin [Chitinophaga skermanii]|uniref:Thioredoxin n=1 Tax=Chitinophaga skermanii TaxID=331697 RepID=A0A327R3W7_9BACT|nr:thioredoxin [Chitinophaga skermanii]RAJ10905.1 thioredoxin [Chitinophaga skermanii]